MKQSDLKRSREGDMGKKYVPWINLTPAERVVRWEGVLRVLTNLTPKQRREEFEMNLWLLNPKNAVNAPTEFKFLDKTKCGTAACAAGYCGIDKDFNKQGFVIQNVFLKDAWIEADKPSFNDQKDVERFGYTFDMDDFLDLQWNAPLNDFFGEAGSSQIFENGDTRPVNDVITEVKSYINNLKIAALEADLQTQIQKLRVPLDKKIAKLRAKNTALGVNIEGEPEEDDTW